MFKLQIIYNYKEMQYLFLFSKIYVFVYGKTNQLNYFCSEDIQINFSN